MALAQTNVRMLLHAQFHQTLQGAFRVSRVMRCTVPYAVSSLSGGQETPESAESDATTDLERRFLLPGLRTPQAVPEPQVDQPSRQRASNGGLDLMELLARSGEGPVEISQDLLYSPVTTNAPTPAGNTPKAPCSTGRSAGCMLMYKLQTTTTNPCLVGHAIFLDNRVGQIVMLVSLRGLGSAEGLRMSLRQGSKRRYSNHFEADKLLSGTSLH